MFTKMVEGIKKQGEVNAEVKKALNWVILVVLIQGVLIQKILFWLFHSSMCVSIGENQGLIIISLGLIVIHL